jgi:Protein of unknown function (DUF1236)
MMKNLIVAALTLAVTAAFAQTPSPPAQITPESLSLDQQKAIGEIITNDQGTALTGTNFTLAIGSPVPPEIELRSIPGTAAELAPQLQGLDYVIVEEQIALVDQRSRKIVSVIPRWRSQDQGRADKQGTIGSGGGAAR